ncbi:hypothetical protein JCM5350_004549 [Sporobolomyces pararoseus]
MSFSPLNKSLLNNSTRSSAFDSPSTSSSFSDESTLNDSVHSSSYSRRPSSTTISVSSLSSRKPSLNPEDYSNSAYKSPSTVPLLGRSAAKGGEGKKKRWSHPKEWRRLTWIKLTIWTIPTIVLLVVLLHQRSPLRPSRETVAKLRQQIDSILHSTSSYSCPNPLLGRPTTSFDDPTTLTPFESIKTNNTAFSLALSYSTTTCNSFRIRISRNNPAVCLKNLDKPNDLNEDPATVEWIRKLGPDTFQLRVDGAERFVVDEPSRYDPERCEYYFDFPLSNSGAVWLNGIHFYENYDAYNSQPRHEIDRLLDPLFSTPLQLSLCPPSCATFNPPLLSHPPSTFSSSLNLAKEPSLPICSSLSPISGAYVPSAYPSLLYPPYQLPQTPTRPSAGYHTFIPSSCRFSHDGLRFRNHDSCLKEENRVLFIGDSHTRGLYDVMLKRLEGNDEMALTSFKVANKQAKIGNLHLEFLWDPFLEASFDCSYMSQFTHVVISTGSHQACYRCPQTASYISHMSSIFSSWPRQHSNCSSSSSPSRPGSKSAKFVFVTSPSWYPQKIEKFDCRTSQRLTRWNELATKEALGEGWGVVDAQSLTRSIAVDTRLIDGVHYIKTDAIDPMVDELIMKLGICQ